ncbi:uncharacterized protein LOC141606038 [Silene latifolia]|uniref:uncharacterized protein LOC141606038 n=1 Tax=Silene latifolia TaxID=37657 RepID=UPI003D788DFD
MALPPTPQYLLSPQASPPQQGGGQSIIQALLNAYPNKLLQIEVMMIGVVIMSCVMLLGSLRKRTSNGFFKLCLWTTVVLTPLLFSYIVGLMMTNIKNELFIVWGLLLLVGMASYGTISAFQLEDNETAAVVYLRWFLKCSFVFGMIVGDSKTLLPAHLYWLVFILMPFVFFRLEDRVSSLAFASKKNLLLGVGSKVQIVAEFMAWDAQKTLEAEDEEAADANSMNGYRYLVGMKHLCSLQLKPLPPLYHRNFEKVKENIVTTQEIWQCEGDLLNSNGGDCEGWLKDTCLSFALFWMLLRRYVGYPMVELNSLEEKTWNFFRYGLTPEISPATCERTFRVIEQELSFVYDYFYTKNFVIYLKGTWSMIRRFLVMVAFIVIAVLILQNHRDTQSVRISDHLPSIKPDIIITKVVIYAMLVFELVFMIHYLLITQWSIVEWVCTYVGNKLWRSQTWKDRCYRWAIEHICRYSLGRTLKHWKQEIDQYSLLKSHDYKFPLYDILSLIVPFELINKTKRGRKKCKSITFSLNLKATLVSSLHANGRNLTNGISSLRKYGVDTDFSWACNLETHTHTILVWHIATSFCELSHLNRHPAGNVKSDNVFVATSLSKYCAYLVAFVPELLPDQRNTIFNIINCVILEANSMFKGCSNIEAKYEKMRSLTGEYKDAEYPILEKGMWLGRSLIDRMSDDSLWEMLGEFWAELLLYLAPSDDVAAHLKHLANGGELITHLWTLLTHAAILKRL